MPPGWAGTAPSTRPASTRSSVGVHPFMTGIVRVEGTATPTPSPSPEPFAVPVTLAHAVAEPLADRDARSAGHDDHRRPAAARRTRRSASFTFTSTQPSATFECKLDTPSGTGTYTSCTSPRAYTTTANGTYTFSRPLELSRRATPTRHPRPEVSPSTPDHRTRRSPAGRPAPRARPRRASASRAEPGATFECKLDRPSGAGTYALCTSPQAYTAALDGSYTFSVRAIDAAGNVDPTPATRTFTVDTTTPDTTINTGPTGTITTGAASFTFSGTELGLARSSASSTAPARPPARTRSAPRRRRTRALADGTYTFSVRAIDAAGNLDPTPATRTLHGRHDGAGHDPDGHPADVQLHPSEAGATFECKLDGPGATTGTYAACTSPQNLGTLADGTYTFSVRAKDAAGNVDPTPATRTFTVDTTAPDTTINSGPTGTIAATTASFAFSSEAGATFECKLDRPSGAGTYATCTSPQAYSGLTDGAYTFSVRAKDAAGNVDATPATRTFTVDTTAPDTTHHQRDHGRLRVVRVHQRGGRDVRVQARPARPAPAPTPRAPRRRPTRGLTDGTYTFSVRASDAAGNVDATPATRTFTVDTTAPDTTITGGPPSFTFTSSEANATFECKLDGPGATTGTYATCTSPQAYTALTDGTYTFSVRARTPPATSTRRPPRGRSPSTPPRRRRRSRGGPPSFTFTSSEAELDVRVQARRPRRGDRHVRRVHLAAGVHRPGRRDLHVLGPRQGRRRQRRPVARDPDVHRRHDGAGHDADRHRRRRSASPRQRDRLDLRVQARRSRRGHRHLRGLHLAAHADRPGRRHLHVLRPRDRRGRQRRRHARPRARSRSTPRRRTRPSPAAPRASPTRRAPRSASRARRARRSSASSTAPARPPAPTPRAPRRRPTR